MCADAARDRTAGAAVRARPIRLALVAAGLWALCLGGGAMAGANTVMIVDASNSMNSPFDRGSRIEALKASVASTLPASADKLDLGVVVFGGREALDCNDVEMKVAPAAGNAETVLGAIQSVGAQGVSALAQALDAAARAAGYRERAATIVAVADNAGVDNCKLDTCATAEALRRDSVDLRVHVVAVDAKDDELAKLQCIATLTGGRFINVRNRIQLASALSAAYDLASGQEQKVVELPVLPPRPKPLPSPPLSSLTPREKPAADEAAVLAPGEAEPAATQGTSVADNVSVFAPSRRPDELRTADDPAAEDADAPGGTGLADAPATPDPMAPPPAPTDVASIASQGAAPGADTGPPSSQARVLVDPEAAARATPSATLPAPPNSTILVRRRPGQEDGAGQGNDRGPERAAQPGATPPDTTPPGATPPIEPAPASAEPAPGQIAAADPAAGASRAAPAATGRLKLAALIIENTKPIPNDIAWQVFAGDGAAADKQPIARSSDPEPEFELPAGDYLVEGRFGHAVRTVRANVAADGAASATLVLEAGGLQIDPVNAGTKDAADGVLNTVYAAGTTANPVAADVPSGQVVYLNAGVYRVESRYGAANALASADIEIQPGKLVRAKINHRAGPANLRLVEEARGAPLEGASWQIFASDGTLVLETADAAPRAILAEGSYDAVARRGGATFRSTFAIKAGEQTEVEILAR